MISDWTFWAVLLGTVVVHWLLPERARAWFLAISSCAYVAFLEFQKAQDPLDIRLGFISLLLLGGLFFWVSQNVKRRVAPDASPAMQNNPGDNGGFSREARSRPQTPGPPRAAVLALVVVVLGYLGYYKYFPAIHRLISAPEPPMAAAVPLGASYFTFKLIHYILESSRQRTLPDGTTKPNIPRHGIDVFLAYVFFFPIFTAGPIERFDAFFKDRASKLRRDDVVVGLTRIIYGLVKKFVIVDLVLSRVYASSDRPTLVDAIPLWAPALRLDQLLPELHNLSPVFAWQYLINQFVSTYLDFSAYSDIAIGAALLFGVRIMENFNWPILATNIGEFWKRWHMSLSGWCQQYVYLPMIGRTRNPYIAVYATQIAIGVWHGATLNFLAWGAYHGTLMVTFLTWGRIKRKKKWKFEGRGFDVAGAALTFLCVSAGHAFVATNSLGFRPAVRLLVKLFGYNMAGLMDV